MTTHPVPFSPDDTGAAPNDELDRCVAAWWRMGIRSAAYIWQREYNADSIADVEASIERQGLGKEAING